MGHIHGEECQLTEKTLTCELEEADPILETEETGDSIETVEIIDSEEIDSVQVHQHSEVCYAENVITVLSVR